MEDLYRKAYKEVYEILQYIPEEELKKIPPDILKTIELNMDKEYNYIVNDWEDFEEQNLLKESKAILAVIYRDYWANPEQRKRILAKQNYDIKIHEEELVKKYNPDNIFKKLSNTQETIEIEIPKNSNNTALIEYKESFFTKLKNFIFKILHINK